MSKAATESLVVVANRLPVAWSEEAEAWRASPGGLVSALAPILREREGLWVGWTGTADLHEGPFEFEGIRQVPVTLSAEEVEHYYEGFCNATIWPLYHDAIRPVEIHRHWWRPYREVNRRFAETTAEATPKGAPVWVHDYQLQLVPEMVRQLLPHNRIGFFLHIPFPPVEIFGRLPWREEVLAGLLGADVIGFQTRRAAINFARAAREIGGAKGPSAALEVDGRTVVAEPIPISIDVQAFGTLARSEEVGARAKELRHDLNEPRWIVLGVDRLDYTKGIDLRMRAFETLLHARPDLHGQVVYVQVAVPSREGVEEYQVMRERIEHLVGRINGEFGRPDWVPIHYQYRSLDRPELVAYYRAADVLLVTPLRDGMNLVAKEYIASRFDLTGVLVLSEFAGAAEQLEGALIVNPYDLDELAAVLERAVELPADELEGRMRRLRRGVVRWDVHDWAQRCLSSLEEHTR